MSDKIRIGRNSIILDTIPPNAGVGIQIDPEGFAVGLVAMDTDGYDHALVAFRAADDDGKYRIKWADLIAAPITGMSPRY